MARLKRPLCPGCALPGWDDLCPVCQRRPLELSGIAVNLVFEGVARKAVHQLKYRNLRALAPSMATVMAEALRTMSPPVDALVPIPLHRRQLRRRGYNHSAVLAREVGWRLDIPVSENALRRVTEGPSQVSLTSREGRWANVADAFAPAASVEGKDIVLVDDVMTTGGTLHSAGAVLRQAGAQTVWALVFARDV